MYDFFVAHAGSDTPQALTLHDALHPAHHVFLDKKSLEPGPEWNKALAEALVSSRVIIILLSQNSLGAYYLQEEITRAIQLYRSNRNWYKVVPVYLDGFPEEIKNIPYGLYQLHSIDVIAEGGLTLTAQKLTALLSDSASSDTDMLKLKDKLKLKHVLHDYPVGPMVEGHWVSLGIIEAVAEFVEDSMCLQVIYEANAFRQEADPSEEGSILIRKIKLPNPNRNNAMEFWLAAFTQARLHGPRMLAALLMSVQDSFFPKAAREEKNALLRRLKNYQ